MSLRFDQCHNKDRHDGRETEKFPRYDPPNDASLVKMAPHKLPISGKWPPSKTAGPPSQVINDQPLRWVQGVATACGGLVFYSCCALKPLCFAKNVSCYHITPKSSQLQISPVASPEILPSHSMKNYSVGSL